MNLLRGEEKEQCDSYNNLLELGYQYKSKFVVVQCCGVDGCLSRAHMLEARSPAFVAVKK